MQDELVPHHFVKREVLNGGAIVVYGPVIRRDPFEDRVAALAVDDRLVQEGLVGGEGAENHTCACCGRGRGGRGRFFPFWEYY